MDEKTIREYIESQKSDEDDQGSRLPRPPSLEPAVSRGVFRRLQPHARLSVGTEPTALRRWMFSIGEIEKPLDS